MRKIAFCLLIIIVLSSCSKNESNNKQANSTNTTDSTTSSENMSSFKSNNVIKSYDDYLATLPPKEVKSMGFAYDKFSEIKTNDTEINDKLFEMFYDFYSYVFDNIHDSLSDGKIYDEAVLLQNGFQTKEYEEGKFIFPDIDYLSRCFLSYVSDGLAEFIKLDYEDMRIRDGGFLITDSYLIITRDELSDMFIKWENYMKKYPSNEWTCKIAEQNTKFYIYLYTDIEMITFSDMRGETDTKKDIHHTYKRFIERYPTSGYFGLINEYYQVLFKDGVKKTDATANILKKYGIED